MYPIKRLTASMLVTALLAACASDDVAFYKHSPSIKPLEVPPDLTAPETKDDFNIPQIGVLLVQEPVLASGAKVKLHRDGQLRWLEINAEPNAVWQQVRDFFLEHNVDLDWENTGLGILETDWVKNYDTRFARDKFRVRVEPGDKPGTTELYVTHRGQYEYLGGGEIRPRWEERPNDPELEIEVLGQMLVFMGLSREQRDELIQQAQKKEVKYALDIDSEIPSIGIETEYPRAWKLVIRAADRLGYIVEERDEKAGKLSIRLGKVGVDEGFVPGHSLIGLGREVYNLQLIDEKGEARLEVLTKSGERDNSKAARDFLARLYEKLQ